MALQGLPIPIEYAYENEALGEGDGKDAAA